MKRILLDIDTKSTRMALTEDGRLSEFCVEVNSAKKLVGNIYKGKVVNVLPGMQAAFVSIGQEKNSFLYVGDTMLDKCDLPKNGFHQGVLSLKTGDIITVQVVKDENGGKGARVTENISLPGRLVVYAPTINSIGVSHKIEDEGARARLQKIAECEKREKEGFILRTAAQNASKDEIIREIELLRNKYAAIEERFKNAAVNDMIYSEGDIVTRTLRDFLDLETDEILINDRKAYQAVLRYIAENLSGCNADIILHSGSGDMFETYGINSQIEELISRKVELDSGAYLVIDRTEALNVIDVNTGKYIGGNNLEDTVFATNMEAAAEIARQIRLRNLSGIIIIDFIDMERDEHKAAVVEALREHVKSDRIKCMVVGMTALGLVELTRKKIRKELGAEMQECCPYCGGNASVPSVRYVARKIKVSLKNLFDKLDPPAAVVTVSSNVMPRLFSEGHFSAECESVWGAKRIYIVPDELFKTDEFRISAESRQVIDLPPCAKLLY